MNLELPDSVLSAQDLKALIQDVQNYARWFSQNSIKAKVTGQMPTEPLVVSDAAAGLIADAAKEKPHDTASLDALLLNLKNLESTLPRVTITLAALPAGSLKKALAGWCRQNISKNILVDFRFNATILGGMVVRYGSHVHDWSFRRQILAARSKFPEVLRHV